MKDHYEYREWPPPSRWLKLRWAALSHGGAITAGVTAGTLAAHSVTGVGSSGALVIIVGGAFATVVGVVQRRTWFSQQYALGTPTFRVDENGIWVRTDAGPSEGESPAVAKVPWAAVEAMVIEPMLLSVPDEDEPVLRNVLYFALADEAAVEHDPYPPSLLAEASELGISPAAASMGMVLAPRRSRVARDVIGWLRAHRPDVPVRDLRV